MEPGYQRYGKRADPTVYCCQRTSILRNRHSEGLRGPHRKLDPDGSYEASVRQHRTIIAIDWHMECYRQSSGWRLVADGLRIIRTVTGNCEEGWQGGDERHCEPVRKWFLPASCR